MSNGAAALGGGALAAAMGSAVVGSVATDAVVIGFWSDAGFGSDADFFALVPQARSAQRPNTDCAKSRAVFSTQPFYLDSMNRGGAEAESGEVG